MSQVTMICGRHNVFALRKWMFHHSLLLRSARAFCSETSTSGPPWRILFLGTDEFSLPHFEALHHNSLQNDGVVRSLEVVIPKAKSASDMCVVGKYAYGNDINGHVWPYRPPSGQFDVGVVASFGHLLPESLIQAFPHGILNVHPSLLPKYRGSAPINHAILNGDSMTGVSIMQIVPHKFDVGPLLLQETFHVNPCISAVELRDQLSKLGSAMLLHTLKNLQELEASSKPQSESEVSKAPKLKIHHSKINWEMQTEVDIDRQYRAISHVLSLQSLWCDQVIKLLDKIPLAEMLRISSELPQNLPPGSPVFHKHSATLCIRCKDGWVGFQTVVIKKPMSALAFYNGYISADRSSGQVFQSQDNFLTKYYSCNKAKS